MARSARCRVADPATAEPLALELRHRAEREVEHLDRMPAAQRHEPGAVGVVVPALDLGRRRARDGRPSGGRGRSSPCRPDGRASRDGRSCARRRTPPSSGRGRKWRQQPRTTPKRSGTAARTSFSVPPRGHQNSSASEWITQSAPCSVAARRAIRVTHRPGACRRRPPGGGGGALCARTARGSPSFRRSSVVRRDDEVDSRVQVEGELRVDHVGLVTRQERHDEPHPSTARASTTASTTRSAARPSTTPTTCSTARRRSAGELVRTLERALDPGDDLLERSAR